jgi:hypothetical protein
LQNFQFGQWVWKATPLDTLSSGVRHIFARVEFLFSAFQALKGQSPVRPASDTCHRAACTEWDAIHETRRKKSWNNNNAGLSVGRLLLQYYRHTYIYGSSFQETHGRGLFYSIQRGRRPHIFIQIKIPIAKLAVVDHARVREHLLLPTPSKLRAACMFGLGDFTLNCWLRSFSASELFTTCYGTPKSIIWSHQLMKFASISMTNVAIGNRSLEKILYWNLELKWHRQKTVTAVMIHNL